MTRDEMKKRDSEPKMVRVYTPETVAPMLSEEQPFFKTASGAVYAIATRNVKGAEVPTNFIKVGPKFDGSGRQRRKARKAFRKEQRRIEHAADNFRKTAAGQ